jgi:hypothetical protein
MSMTPGENRFPGVLRWVLIVGAVGFAAGFLGPITFNPEANQGPLLGIFITGPAGASLGLVLHAICRVLRVSEKRQWQMLWTASAVLAVATLYFCFPRPALRGELIDAHVRGCEPPAQRVDTAIDYWRKRVSEVTWASPRPDWQADARQMSEVDDGTVLNVVVARRNRLFEQMKPWNKGRIVASGWQIANEPKSYYVPFPGACTDYSIGENSVRFVPYDLSSLTNGATDWPPKKISDFLDLQTLDPVPGEYRKFVGN